jgi:hypothetical protein
MPTLGHIYLTAHGEYITAPWAGERAQIGVRLAVAEELALPGKGTTFTPLENGDVVIDGGTQAGTNGTLTRTWSARLGPTGSLDNADAAMQADLGDDFWTFLNATKGLLSSSFRWTHVKIAPITAAGKYAAPSAVYQFTTPLTGGIASNMNPPELACAVSFRAPVIGRRGRGRFYMPALSKNAIDGTNGTVASATRTGLRDAAATLVANLENLPGTEEYTTLVAVMSAGSETAVRPSEIRVGDHWDVQRRRQDQALEVYSSVAL